MWGGGFYGGGEKTTSPNGILDGVPYATDLQKRKRGGRMQIRLNVFLFYVTLYVILYDRVTFLDSQVTILDCQMTFLDSIR